MADSASAPAVSGSVGKAAILLDGTVVDTASEEYRHECEARAILTMPNKEQRQTFLYGTLDKNGVRHKGVKGLRGQKAVDALERTIMALWEGRKDGKV